MSDFYVNCIFTLNLKINIAQATICKLGVKYLNILENMTKIKCLLLF